MYKFELKTEELSDIKTLAHAEELKTRMIMLSNALDTYICNMTVRHDSICYHLYSGLKQQANLTRCLLDQIS